MLLLCEVFVTAVPINSKSSRRGVCVHGALVKALRARGVLLTVINVERVAIIVPISKLHFERLVYGVQFLRKFSTGASNVTRARQQQGFASVGD